MTPINTELFAFAVRRAEEGLENEPDAFAADLDIIEALLDRCEIRVLPEDRFFVRIDVENIPQKIIQLRRKRCASLRAENGLQEGFDARAHTGSNDFGHTSADWDAVIRLGIFGLRERAASCAARFTGEEKRRAFYAGLCRTYDAALRFMARAAAEAKRRGKDEMAAGLARLCSARPSTLFEAMQTSVVYYTLQQFFDGSVLRTLGRVDSLFYPFCEGEDPAFIEALTADYLEEIDRFRATANLPFALGGRDAAGRSLVNPLSYRFLRAYRSARTTSVKLHLLCAECTPEPFLAEALDAVRSGRNSIVFLSDEKIVEALIRLGEDPADAADYRVVGCYECGGRDEVTCSCGTRVSIPKALEYALNGGVDSVTGKNVGLPFAGPIGSFEDFWKEFERQLVRLCEEAMRETDLWEERDAAFHSAPILSATYESALEKGGDLYCDHSAKYANSSLNAVGLATAADSLAAVRRLVFEEKRFSLDGLAGRRRKRKTEQKRRRLPPRALLRGLAVEIRRDVRRVRRRAPRARAPLPEHRRVSRRGAGGRHGASRLRGAAERRRRPERRDRGYRPSYLRRDGGKRAWRSPRLSEDLLLSRRVCRPLQRARSQRSAGSEGAPRPLPRSAGAAVRVERPLLQPQ